MPPRPASATMRYRSAMICPGTKRPPPIASELESVPAEAEGGRGTRGVEYLGAADGVRPGATGTGESSVTPSLISEAAPSIVVAPSKPPSSVSPIPMGSSPKTVAPLSTSGAVDEPHDEQKRALVETCLPQDEQNMEGRFYQRTRPKTILWIFPAATVTLRLVCSAPEGLNAECLRRALHLYSRPVSQHLGHSLHDLSRVVPHSDHRVGAMLTRVLQHQFERILARLLAKLR